MTTFRTTLLQLGNNVGIEVPEDVVLSFGAGRRVPVTVTLKHYTYSSTISVMGGKYLIPLSAAHRAASGASGGEELDVTLVHDAAPREVAVPDDVAAALDDAGARGAFDASSFTKRKEWVRSVEDAKTPETRERRIAKMLDQLAPPAG